MQGRKDLYVKGGAGIAAILAAAVLGGCGGGAVSPISNGGGGPPGVAPASGAVPTAVAEAEKSGTPVDPAIVVADNAFGLKLLNTLTQGADGNVAISPISVALALQIVYNGAAGTTQAEVDESGTVAAGATTVTIVTAVAQASTFTMTMDHPFLYAIQDGKTGSLLFVGLLLNPS